MSMKFNEGSCRELTCNDQSSKMPLHNLLLSAKSSYYRLGHSELDVGRPISTASAKKNRVHRSLCGTRCLDGWESHG